MQTPTLYLLFIILGEIDLIVMMRFLKKKKKILQNFDEKGKFIVMIMVAMKT